MSPLALAALLLTASGNAVLAADSSIGPTSESEARILWKEGQSFYEQGNCEGAVPRLRRLVDRYPGYPNAELYRKIRFGLGRCYFKLDRDKEALKELKSYLEGPGDHEDADQAKSMIGEVQLRLRKHHEAYLTSQELEKSRYPVMKTKALLLRSHVLIAMDRDEKSKATVASALSLAEQLKSNDLLGEAHAVRLELMTRECARHPSKGRQEESRIRTEIETRGTCLSEALVQFRQVLSQHEAASSDRALAITRGAFEDFRKACLQPPDPPRLTPKDRTAAQLKSYRAELTDHLTLNCGDHRKTAGKLILNWKQETPAPSEFVLTRLQTLEESLK